MKKFWTQKQLLLQSGHHQCHMLDQQRFVISFKKISFIFVFRYNGTLRLDWLRAHNFTLLVVIQLVWVIQTVKKIFMTTVMADEYVTKTVLLEY